MTKTVRFSCAAEEELEAIGDWIALDNPRRAVSFIQELAATCKKIGYFPTRFSLVTGMANIRKRVHGNYVIYYRVGGEFIDILHIFHGAIDRDETDLFEAKTDDV